MQKLTNNSKYTSITVEIEQPLQVRKDSMNYDEDHDEGTSMRAEWEFIYTAEEVAEAAERKVKYHGDRAAWWEGESKKAEEELKQKGFEYRSRERSMGADIEIVGDPELAKRVSTSKQKIREHREKEELFSTWVRALKAVTKHGKSQELTLTIADILFFGL